jgi:predicted transcriptional regulator
LSWEQVGYSIRRRSPTGQAIKRQFSETEQTVRDRLRAGTEDRSASCHDEGDATSRDKQIVRERYARGEIDRKQYLEMLDDLKNR